MFICTTGFQAYYSDWFNSQSIRLENGWWDMFLAKILGMKQKGMRTANPIGFRETQSGEKIYKFKIDWDYICVFIIYLVKTMVKVWMKFNKRWFFL